MVKRIAGPNPAASAIIIPLEAIAEMLVETAESQTNFSNGAMQSAINRLNKGPDPLFKRYPQLFPKFIEGALTKIPSHAENKQLARYSEQLLSELQLVTASTAKGAGGAQDQITGFKASGIDEVDPGKKYPSKFLRGHELTEKLDYSDYTGHRLSYEDKATGKIDYDALNRDTKVSMYASVMDMLTKKIKAFNAGKLGALAEIPGGLPTAGYIGASLEEVDTVQNVGRQSLETDVQRELQALSEGKEPVPSVSEVDKQMEKLKRLPGEFDPETPKYLVPTAGKIKSIRVSEAAVIAFKEANNDVMATLARYGPEDERNYLKAIWSRIAKNQPSAGGANVTKREVRQIAHYLYLQGYLKQDPGFGDQLVNSELTSKQVPKNLFPTAKAMKEMGDDGDSFRILRPGQPLVITPEVEVKTKKAHSMVADIKKQGLKGLKIGLKGLGPIASVGVGTGLSLAAGASWSEALGAGFEAAIDPSYPAGEGSTIYKEGSTAAERAVTDKEFRKSQKEWAEHNTIMRANPGLVLPEGNRIVHDIFTPPEIEEMLRDAELKQAEEGMANRPGPLEFEQEQYRNTPMKLLQ